MSVACSTKNCRYTTILRVQTIQGLANRSVAVVILLTAKLKGENNKNG